MKAVEAHDATQSGPNPQEVLEQLQRVVQDEVFRSSRRSVAFLSYVVQQALKDPEEQIKERAIGVEVFGRSSAYDTSLDHIVRTAATEVRKRLAIYYGSDEHREELHISLIPGSYAPHFTPAHAESGSGRSSAAAAAHPSAPADAAAVGTVAEALPAADAPPPQSKRRTRFGIVLLCMAVLAAGALTWVRLERPSPDQSFWKPILDASGPVLLVAGDVPSGPPTLPLADPVAGSLPVPGAARTGAVPFGDTVTIARVVGSLEAHGKKVVVRQESSSSFSDLRQGAAILVGAFNNDWSLRLTNTLRYSLALDPDRHVIYIRDSKNPAARNWSWPTNQPPNPPTGINSPKRQDYALISRIQSSQTGQAVVVIGGLYTYGTEAAGDFLTNSAELAAILPAIRRAGSHGNVQIVIQTTVTDDTPGPPVLVAVSYE